MLSVCFFDVAFVVMTNDVLASNNLKRVVYFKCKRFCVGLIKLINMVVGPNTKPVTLLMYIYIYPLSFFQKEPIKEKVCQSINLDKIIVLV